MIKDLKKLKFPTLTTSLDESCLYNHMKKWFDNNGYIYNQDYKFEWTTKNTGNYVPDYIYCNDEIAIMLKLRYDI